MVSDDESINEDMLVETVGEDDRSEGDKTIWALALSDPLGNIQGW